ncbi:MAG: RHH-type proline utilization regulon transcriptional repressor/proline dehydrogenase [Saprospiraceae bacterium]|jgi:RHH-type proline utilization regulon transcriptional repressor/proline dehydrogenase/delta 1-pyrroline-5-carboxylate dehydrogenase
MKLITPFHIEAPLRLAIRNAYLRDEQDCFAELKRFFEQDSSDKEKISSTAYKLVKAIRDNTESHGGLDAFLQEFKLSSEEGIAMMCLAEALLRIPDSDTADALIQDKIQDGNWQSHIGNSDSFFVNASSWGLMLTGKFVKLNKRITTNPTEYVSKLVAQSGEPVIRAAMIKSMQIMGQQFVLAENMRSALKRARDNESKGYRYSYDMLGEAARTAKDAEFYFKSYSDAIDRIGKNQKPTDAVTNPGISVKLSALHPRYEYAQEQRVIEELLPKLILLCEQAAAYNIGLTIDAEESERLEPSLTLLEKLFEATSLSNWDGLGFVVQAYQKRAMPVLNWIEDMAIRHKRKIMIRLVKGAYWDSEVKNAQILGLKDYPVYTQKFTTDVAYLQCADKLLSNREHFYPLFATHNAHTVASILCKADSDHPYEFQCLHGMGETLYDQVITQHDKPVRIYAPVGEHKDLLAYLVRRLLENGANSSFVNRLVDKDLPIEEIIADPADKLIEAEHVRHPKIPLPADFLPERINSAGFNADDANELHAFYTQLSQLQSKQWGTTDAKSANQNENVLNPATGAVIGNITQSNEQSIGRSMESAQKAFENWNALKGNKRAKILETAADLFEQHRDTLLSLCILEAGKTVLDAVAELREAVDFLRYYAAQARRNFTSAKTLVGPTGETNQHLLSGRGVFVCISPWNFPLAIFTGQMSAALAAGNCVLAKPADQTPVIASIAVKLMHEAGVPKTVLQLHPGSGSDVGAKLTALDSIAGVTFTGSTQTARYILNTVTQKPGAIIPFIAETGGINAMIADSSTLIEQLVDDVVQSAFQSAGQRCSALRVLYVQDDIYTNVVDKLKGAMDQLITGNPVHIKTDIGPIIDQPALDNLNAHIDKKRIEGKPIYRSPSATLDTQDKGTYFQPALIEFDGIEELDQEVFGPILHIARYKAKHLDKVIDAINNTGYGLTFGIHSRIDLNVKYISERIHAGNIYVNRNTIGAVVGVQPFGGEGLSGTGPKAGGPHYLTRFAHERVISINTSAAGGNASLLSL